MRLLRVKGFELTRDDYQVIRHVYNVLDSAIHNYNDYKSSIFNIRSFYKLAKKYNESTSEIEKIKIPNNAEIQKIYTNFNYTMIKAFFTFTPLLKSELFIRVLIYFLSVLSRFGKNYLTNRIKFIIEFFNNFEKQKNTYGFAG